MNFRAKTVKESIVETVHIIRPSDLNDAGRLFGGVLMQWIDEVAALVAKRHSHRPTTLPRLILESEEDRKEWERAEIRRSLRRKQREEGFHFYGE